MELQVDLSRQLARDAYRAEQHNPELQVEWKTQVSTFKITAENLKEVRESYYRCAPLQFDHPPSIARPCHPLTQPPSWTLTCPAIAQFADISGIVLCSIVAPVLAITHIDLRNASTSYLHHCLLTRSHAHTGGTKTGY